MFYIFYSGADCTFDELGAGVKGLIKTEDAAEGGEILRSTAEELVIAWDWATLTVTEGSRGVQFASEDYEMELRFSFWFEILSREDGWAEQLMSFIGCTLRAFEGDGVLESNGDTPILMRRSGRIVVDDKKLRGTAKFPFQAMNLAFTEGDLERE